MTATTDQDEFIQMMKQDHAEHVRMIEARIQRLGDALDNVSKLSLETITTIQMCAVFERMPALAASLHRLDLFEDGHAIDAILNALDSVQREWDALVATLPASERLQMLAA